MKLTGACGSTVFVNEIGSSLLVTTGVDENYTRCGWGGWVFSYWRRQRKLHRALHKKGERGSVSEILMRLLHFSATRTEAHFFFKSVRELSLVLCLCFCMLFKNCSLYTLGSEGWNKYCLIKSTTLSPQKTLNTQLTRARFSWIQLWLIRLSLHWNDSLAPFVRKRTIWLWVISL